VNKRDVEQLYSHIFIAIATKFRLIVGYVKVYEAHCTYAGYDVICRHKLAVLNFEAAILNSEHAVIQLTMMTLKNI